MTLFLHLWHVAVWVSAVLGAAVGLGAIWWAVDQILTEVQMALHQPAPPKAPGLRGTVVSLDQRRRVLRRRAS